MSKLAPLSSSTPYRDMAHQLGPRGPLWTLAAAGYAGLLAGMAEEATRFHNRLVALMRECFPATASELLAEWEEVFGLPLCTDSAPTLEAERQAALAGRVAAQGGQSRAYYIRLAQAVLGDEQDPVTIVERPWGSVFRAWTGHAWDRVNGLETAFHWWAYLPATATEAQAAIIECLFERYAPAHTVVTVVRPVVAVYESPGGGGDYASASTNVAARTLFPGTVVGPFAVSMWVRQDTANGFNWLGAGYDSGDDAFLSYAAGRVDQEMEFADNGALAGFALLFPPDTAGWVHAAIVCDGSDLTAYIDGAESGTGAVSGTFSAQDTLYLFAYAGAGPTPQIAAEAGALANVAVFGRALTADEVAALAAAGRKHDVRKPLGTGTTWAGETPAVYWRDTDTAGAVASVGDGGDCALELHGSVASADDWT